MRQREYARFYLANLSDIEQPTQKPVFLASRGVCGASAVELEPASEEEQGRVEGLARDGEETAAKRNPGL
jgi:hypothetical protein